ncbi:BTB/POZ domain-containing protein 6-like [Paramacrobiotus metropolitanus]|uniref:BTB/POZ domain-containing protein 6-like n=1 Tax=Paramacrobiotus metropolitanus TaxID=2943436 RepID=UPI002445BD0F|nr:BTB/POZ domain-containing protein 6-like [Paramacrobiotus metropolitanus]
MPVAVANIIFGERMLFKKWQGKAVLLMGRVTIASGQTYGIRPTAPRLQGAANHGFQIWSTISDNPHHTVGRQFGAVKIFAAHKNILSLSSSVFATMFYGSMPQNCQVPIDIPDFIPDAFANLLSYLYTDKVDNLNADNVFHTMNCADKYDVPSLVKICSDFVTHRLDADNCLRTLEEALHWHADKIVEKCWALVDSKAEEIMQSAQFTAISLDTLQKILQRNTLLIGEFEIYTAVEKWATEECARRGVSSSPAVRRVVLDAALFLVRFPLLTHAQLADGPGQSGLLSESQLLSLFLYKDAAVKPELPFSTERRTEFKTGEEVFVHMPPTHWWLPARVTASDTEQVMFTWTKDGTAGTTTADHVVRARDILKRGQVLNMGAQGWVVYEAADRYYHLAEGKGGRQHVYFPDMRLREDHVVAWKKSRGT